MALEQAWFLAFVLPIVAIGVFGLGFLLKRKQNKKEKILLVANTSRFLNTPEYRKAANNYRFGLIAIIVMLVSSLVLLNVVAAKPVAVSSTSATQYNRDIVLCLDVSGSMLEVDNEIIEKFEELVQNFKGERVGLVVWNSSSHMVFPLTDDYDYIQENLNEVGKFFRYYANINSGGSGTGYPEEPKYDIARYTMNGQGGSLIGDGLASCGLAFDKEDLSEQRSKSIILATDNVVNGQPLISLEEATKFVTDEGITLYGIRPTTGYEIGDEAEQMKKAVEETNGGKYYELTNPASTKEIVDRITSEEATAIQGAPVIVKTDTPQWWILGFSVLIMLSMFLMRRFKI